MILCRFQSTVTSFCQRLLLMSLLLFSSVVAGADNEYDIELLVFKLLDFRNDGESLSGYQDGMDGIAGGREVSWLGETGYRLSDTAAAMQRSAGYRPLLHVAWRERVAGRNSAQPVGLPSQNMASTGESVTGTARVGLGRYLHLDLDLVLHDAANRAGAGAASYPQTSAFRLVESRRMRSKEVHYFDHPRFGALALITPVQ